VAADFTSSESRDDFDTLWTRIDAEAELRTEPPAPPGFVSDNALRGGVDTLMSWVRELLNYDDPGHGTGANSLAVVIDQLGLPQRGIESSLRQPPQTRVTSPESSSASTIRPGVRLADIGLLEPWRH
jgi:hypothetical protein